MDSLPDLRRKNAAAAPAKDGTAGFPLVLPEVQTGESDPCAEFSSRAHPSAGRKNTVLTAISAVMHGILWGGKS